MESQNSQSLFTMFYELCRLCLKNPGEQNIPDVDELVEDIFFFTGVRITLDDNLPQKVCYKCHNTLMSAKELRLLATNNDTHLRLLFGEEERTEDMLQSPLTKATSNAEKAKSCEEAGENQFSASEPKSKKIVLRVRKDLMAFSSSSKNRKRSRSKSSSPMRDVICSQVNSTEVNSSHDTNSQKANSSRAERSKHGGSHAKITKAGSSKVNSSKRTKFNCLEAKKSVDNRSQAKKEKVNSSQSKESKDDDSSQVKNSKFKKAKTKRSNDNSRQTDTSKDDCSPAKTSKGNNSKDNSRQGNTSKDDSSLGKTLKDTSSKDNSRLANSSRDDNSNNISSSLSTPVKDEMKNFKDCITKTEDGEYIYQCPVCDKIFDHYKKCYLHRRLHNRAHLCPMDVCGKRFATAGDLKKHIRVHTGEKPFKCPTCDRAFAQRGTLKQHRESVHFDFVS